MEFFDGVTGKYKTVVLDPPWDISMSGITKTRPNRAKELSYTTMSLDEIKDIPIKDIAEVGAHVAVQQTKTALKVVLAEVLVHLQR